jgi:hypothetical protein
MKWGQTKEGKKERERERDEAGKCSVGWTGLFIYLGIFFSTICCGRYSGVRKKELSLQECKIGAHLATQGEKRL